MKLLLLATTLLFTLSGCTSLPFLFTEQPEGKKDTITEIKSEEDTSSHWWKAFNDPLMNRMAAELLAQNMDIQIAEARIAEARGILRSSRSEWFPSIDATASASRGNDQFGAEKVVSISKGGVDARWEIDLFGRTGSQVNAAQSRLEGSTASLEDVQLVMLAELMRAIIEWRQAQETIRTTEALLASQDEQIALFTARNDAGLIDGTLVSRAKAQRSQTSTTLPLAQAAANAAAARIATLVAKPVTELLLEPFQDTPFIIPDVEQTINADISLVRQRPDVRVLRAEMLAAQSELAKAEADMLPRLSIGAFFGVQEGSDGLRIAENPIWSLGSSLTAPLFNAGRLRGAVDTANARAKAASLQYEKGILAAMEETHIALGDYLHGVNAVTEQEKAVSFRHETVKLATERFEQGLTDMTDLTTAQSELDQATLTLIERRATAAVAYIRLHKALGMTISADHAID